MQKQSLLVSLGREDDSPGSAVLKIWNAQSGGPVRAGPRAAPLLCMRTIRAFAAKLPESEITTMSVHEETWPQMTIALGLASGQVLLLRGDVGAWQWHVDRTLSSAVCPYSMLCQSSARF